jgi:hypothetical protein
MTDNDIQQVMNYFDVDKEEAIKIIQDNDKAIIEQVYFKQLYEGVVYH